MRPRIDAVDELLALGGHGRGVGLRGEVRDEASDAALRDAVGIHRDADLRGRNHGGHRDATIYNAVVGEEISKRREGRARRTQICDMSLRVAHGTLHKLTCLAHGRLEIVGDGRCILFERLVGAR